MVIRVFEGRVAGKELQAEEQKRKQKKRRPCRFIIMVPLFPPINIEEEEAV